MGTFWGNAKSKPGAVWFVNLRSLAAARLRMMRAGSDAGQAASIAVEQHALVLLFSHRAVEELVVLEEDLDERRTRLNGALDERF